MAFNNPVRAYLKEFTRYTRINELIEDINELYTLYINEHDITDASHDVSAIGWDTAKAFASVGGSDSGGVVLHSGNFNIRSASINSNFIDIFISNETADGNSVVLAQYMGPNKYRVNAGFVTGFQKITIEVIDTSDNTVQPGALTQDDAVAVVLYDSSPWLADAPSMSNTWQPFGVRVVDQVFGYQSFNKMVNNLKTLKEALSVGHVFENGMHEPYKYGGHGARAFARYASGSLSEFNIDSVDNTATGVYKFNLRNPILVKTGEKYPVICSSNTGASERPIVTKTQKNSFEITVYNNSDNPTNISSVLHAVAWRYI